ncbi:hypothetical protein [Nocardia brasiliensis]|uniref:hypothetical protein n=1 Tax=Nocardia brasiliensis TaxID=37326 RepID=UPI003D8BA6BB
MAKKNSQLITNSTVMPAVLAIDSEETAITRPTLVTITAASATIDHRCWPICWWTPVSRERDPRLPRNRANDRSGSVMADQAPIFAGVKGTFRALITFLDAMILRVSSAKFQRD